ncbi:response regulator [Sphingomonas canadensis]|uniref:histidine kinase n=1 Tax=Sphingomonas canadensis TaxID=1219257 RepID=A0ABW3H1N7_9SPHN|nr:response regulator [Sphingomonas canadensis]MCW3834734.1 response regulator [Sphingomonas canadensis]
MSQKDPLRYFRVEAREITEELGRGVAEFGAGASADLVARMMRLAHTLKGAAGVVKQRAIAERTHALEDALAPMRGREGAVPGDLVEAVAGHVAALAEAVAALDRAPAPRPAARGTPAAGFDEAAGLLRAEAREIDALLTGIAESRVRLRGMRRTTATIARARQLAELVADWTARPGGGAGGASPRMRRFAEELRTLITEAEQGLRDGVEQNERDLAQAHTAAEQLRLLPCAAAFGAFDRALAESAAALGKQAVLTVRGGDIRLDPQVLGMVQRAMIQLLRNAVAHGIETPAARLAAGKPEAGSVTVEVRREGSRIVISCADDGAGIDFAAVRAAAHDRGLPVGDGGEAALLDLLLAGGLSTSAEVTEASGRGVGLDVVREVAARLGARLDASSRAGAGSHIALAIPVSLSSLDALLVEAGGTSVALPLAAVRRAVRLVPGDVARAGGRETIEHDGAAIAVAPLARLLRLASAAGARAAGPAVVLDGGGALAALAVDAIVGTANLVVRPVPPLAFADPVVSATWFDADGVPRPVADPAALAAAAAGLAAPKPEAAPRSLPVLVIDDSLTTRVLEQSILEAAGFSVDLATCAEEGLDMARKRRYGLFLVDVEMPGMDGFGFVETTRADADLRRVPAILVSSRAAPEDIARGMAAGAHAYFIKSEFDQRRVLDTIRKLLLAAA